MVLSGAALAAYLIARRDIDRRRREQGLEMMVEDEREISRRRSTQGDAGEPAPATLSFEERLEWLDRKTRERQAACAK